MKKIWWIMANKVGKYMSRPAGYKNPTLNSRSGLKKL